MRKKKTKIQLRIENLHNSQYKEYIQSPEWQKLCQKHFQWSGFRCRVCNSSGKLEMHHRTYSHVGSERAGDIICLCSECHELIHKHRGIFKEVKVSEVGSSYA